MCWQKGAQSVASGFAASAAAVRTMNISLTGKLLASGKCRRERRARTGMHYTSSIKYISTFTPQRLKEASRTSLASLLLLLLLPPHCFPPRPAHTITPTSPRSFTRIALLSRASGISGSPTCISVPIRRYPPWYSCPFNPIQRVGFRCHACRLFS